MRNERMKFLVDEVNSLTKKKQEMKANNIPLWNWPNEEGRLIKMYVDEIAELKQNNKEEVSVINTHKEDNKEMTREEELVEIFIERLNKREKEKEEEMMKRKLERQDNNKQTKEEQTMTNRGRVPTELELLNELMNSTTKEEEMEKMEIIKEEAENIRLEEIESQKEYAQKEAEVADKEMEVWAEEVFENPVFTKKKDDLVYNKKDKVWMEEETVFRQISQKSFYREVDRIRKVFSKLSIREKKFNSIAKSYTFNNREVFLKLFNNMKKGGYVVIRKDSTSITLGKEWYSFGMRANYYHSLEFSKSKDGEYVIGDIRDRRLLKDHSKRKKYGSRELPITKIGL